MFATIVILFGLFIVSCLIDYLLINHCARKG